MAPTWAKFTSTDKKEVSGAARMPRKRRLGSAAAVSVFAEALTFDRIMAEGKDQKVRLGRLGRPRADEDRGWGSYIEHFLHTPGYVYAYAFGNLLAMSVYHRYLEKGPAFVEDYLAFLAAGGSTRPDELGRRLGRGITDPALLDAGLKILDGMVTEVERLAADS